MTALLNVVPKQKENKQKEVLKFVQRPEMFFCVRAHDSHVCVWEGPRFDAYHYKVKKSIR